MARVDSKQFADKWGRRLKGATEDIKRGIENVTEAPTKKAAAKKDKMRQNIIASIDNGKWERGLNRVTLEDWKQNILTKGMQRLSSGVDGAQSKMEAFGAELLPHIDNVKKSIDGMPDVTLDDSINRMVAFTRGMAQFKRKS